MTPQSEHSADSFAYRRLTLVYLILMLPTRLMTWVLFVTVSVDPKRLSFCIAGPLVLRGAHLARVTPL
jgi:hypothetical protein